VALPASFENVLAGGDTQSVTLNRFDVVVLKRK
jgi:hypothetical protein